jgi:hypothetical protein
MLLRAGGIDVYYIDESNDLQTYVVTAIRVPFLRFIEGNWQITWPTALDAAKAWRRRVNQAVSIPPKKELHGVKLISGRGRYFKGKYAFDRPKASAVYREILRSVDCLSDASIMTVCSYRGGKNLFGHSRLEAAMYALFQRMRRQCHANNTNAITFFDEGHPEYRHLYRRAQVYLPTGSAYGTGTVNLPLDMFTKDANEKRSEHCHFTQMADIIAYAAFLKIKHEAGTLTDWQKAYNLGTLYDEIPRKAINLRVSNVAPRDGILRLK